MDINTNNPPSDKHHHFGSLENTAPHAVETDFESALTPIIEEETTTEKLADIQQQAVAFTSVLKEEVEEVLLQKKTEPGDDDDVHDDEKADNHHPLTRKQVDELLHVQETPPARHSPTTPSEGIQDLQQGLSKTTLQVAQGIATATHTVVDALSNKKSSSSSRDTTTKVKEDDGTIQYRLSNDLVEVFLPTEPTQERISNDLVETKPNTPPEALTID